MPSSPMVSVPRQIWGSLVSHTIMTPVITAFWCCTGCYNAVVDLYIEGGLDFVRRLGNTYGASYLK